MHTANRTRRGTVYLIVLGAAMIVAILGMSSLMLLRIQRRNVESTIDTAKARHYAQTAIEIGLDRIDNDTNWRTTNINGVWVADQTIGDGTFTLEGTDPTDGDLTDSDADSIVLTGIGMRGNARQKIQTTLVPEIHGLSSVTSSGHAGGSILLTGANVQSDQKLSSNLTVVATGSTINADVEATLAISGGSFNGTNTAGVEAREMPPTSVFDFYTTSGTWIDVNLIPTQGSRRQIDGELISPANNPYGATTNASGIYVIDCNNQRLIIQDTRVVGTLVILNPGAGSQLKFTVNCEPAISSYPALLVDGDFDFIVQKTTLDEGTIGRNLNPAGTPYEGVTDSDTLDQYPSIVEGLVYISGDATMSNHPTIDGVLLVGGTLSIDGVLTLSYDSEYYDDPPPGFAAPAVMNISEGSWLRTVD